MAKRAAKAKAVVYLRTSSATNVGGEKDSEHRQREAVHRYARSAGFEVLAEYYDAAVSGADPIETRAGFAALLDRIEENGVRTVIVEDASRFARDLITQELGILSLIKREVRVLTASGDDLTTSEDPTRKLMRQVAGAFAEYERARLVSKLRHARDRKSEALRKAGGRKKRIEGRKSANVLYPDAVREAKRLRRANSKTGERRSFRAISAALAKSGYISRANKPFTATAVKRMVEGPAPVSNTASQ